MLSILGIQSFLMVKVNLRPKSEELKEAKEIVREGLARAEEELDKEEDYTVELGWTESEFEKEHMGGAAGKCHSANRIELKFNTEPDNWRDSLLANTVHEFGHSWHFEQRNGLTEKRWQYVIDEAITQNLAEQLVPEFESPWREKHSIEDISEYWPEIKQKLDETWEEMGHPDPVYISDGEKYPNWLGYSLSYQIGQKLQENYGLKEFPELEKGGGFLDEYST